MQRRPREHDEGHLKFIRALPCIICGDNTATEAAHVSYPDLSVGKRHKGIGEKADDKYTLPLCTGHHRAQSSMNEREFWEGYEIDPVKVALALYAAGDHQVASMICEANKRI